MHDNGLDCPYIWKIVGLLGFFFLATDKIAGFGLKMSATTNYNFP